MRRPPLLLAAFVAVVAILLLWAGGALGATTTLTPTLDTSVDASYSNTTFASGTDLVAGYPRQTLRIDGDPTRFALLRFEVPALYGTPTAATLRLYKRVGSPSEPMNVKTVDCSAWSAATTYNSRPARGVIAGSFSGYTTSSTGAYTSAEVNPAYVGSGAPACFAVDKDIARSTWITLDSSEQTYKPQLVVTSPDAPPPPPTDTDGDGVADSSDACPNQPGPSSNGGCPVVTPPPSYGSVSDCADAPAVNVTPSTMASTLANYGRIRIVAQPGTYSSLSKSAGANSCVSIKCAVTAKSGTFDWNRSGCLVANQSTFQNVKDLTVEGFVVRAHGDGEYGLQHYDQANVGSNTRFANNVFDNSTGGTDHDISTKNRGKYFEIDGNWFLNCRRHCMELGQNGNIRSRPSTTGTTAVTNNTAYSSTGNIITQRYSLNLIVENNTFKGAAGRVVMNWPYWAKYNFPDSGAEAACRAYSENGDLYVPGSTPCEGGQIVPLRTVIRNNTMTGKSDLLFISRGVIDDTVLLQGNTGITSCSRPASMDYWSTGTEAAHINEQRIGGLTTAPKLDPTSDRSC